MTPVTHWWDQLPDLDPDVKRQVRAAVSAGCTEPLSVARVALDAHARSQVEHKPQGLKPRPDDWGPMDDWCHPQVRQGYEARRRSDARRIEALEAENDLLRKENPR